MNASEEKAGLALDEVITLITEAGYETADGGGEGCLYVKDPESGLTYTCVLENNILFNTVACVELSDSVINAELMRKLLDADNGISTSAFQLYHTDSGKSVITLNNFCKLLEMGAEDRDDILSCLEFLNIDVLAARELLNDYL